MRKIIIDCDPGHDDAIALLLATRADSLQVIGVTTVAGNSELASTSYNALRILNYADVYDIPVYAGCDRPLSRDLFRMTGAIIHGEDGLGGPVIPAPTSTLEKEHAVDYIIRTLRESKEKITIVPTGPLTNIALALIKAPDIKDKIEELIIMGGAVMDAGNVTSAAEFNIFVDPEAAKKVINSAIPIRLFSLDVTMKAVFYKDDIETLRQHNDKVSKIVAELLDFFGSTHEIHFGFHACPIHDALCIASMIDDSLFEYRDVYMDISINDPLTLGETVADIWNITGKKPNVKLATSVNREAFVKLITSHMKKEYISKN